MTQRFAALRQKFQTYLKIKELVRDFFSGEMLYYAASLSFYTIFALVPILLIFITIMANLPSFEVYIAQIKEELFSNMIPSKSDALAGYMDTILNNGLKMGLMGIFYVILTSLLFFNNYEYIVSKIFLKPQKSFFKALSTYWTLITFTPLVLALVLFTTADASAKITSIFSLLHLPLKTFLSFGLIWIMFFILMKVSINFSLSTRAVLRSAFLTAFVWYIAQKLFISYIFANTTYESLYGSFSSLLFFFLWIYISWIIYLYGLKSCSFMQRYLEHREHKRSCAIADRALKEEGLATVEKEVS